MSCAVWSFFKSHVRLDALPANGTVTQPAPDACTLTSVNVTSNAFASLNGLSFSITVINDVPLAGDGDVGLDELVSVADGAPPQPAALTSKARMAGNTSRMTVSSSGHRA
jgi:hypothetical protein